MMKHLWDVFKNPSMSDEATTRSDEAADATKAQATDKKIEIVHNTAAATQRRLLKLLVLPQLLLILFSEPSGPLVFPEDA